MNRISIVIYALLFLIPGSIFSCELHTPLGCSDITSSNSITCDGESRTYSLLVPTCYQEDESIPLVIDIHGLGSDGLTQSVTSGFKELAEDECFIVAWPDGVDDSWNSGAVCCGNALANGVDDHGFIVKLVKKIVSEYNVDKKHIYATGISNGGALSHLLGIRSSNIFAAIVPMSMPALIPPTQLESPTAVFMIHGEDDGLVDFDGNRMFPSSQKRFEEWAGANNCTDSKPQIYSLAGNSNSECQKFTQCSDGVETHICVVPGGHVIYINNPDIARLAWNFMSRFGNS
ncbi:MAG: PHB depolymerase family esterase [Desulfobacteraceae bacterium]